MNVFYEGKLKLKKISGEVENSIIFEAMGQSDFVTTISVPSTLSFQPLHLLNFFITISQYRVSLKSSFDVTLHARRVLTAA